MGAVTLAKPDIGLYADFADTRVEIPHLIVAHPSEEHDETLVTFLPADDAAHANPTAFRGTGRLGTMQITCRSTHQEHGDLLALLDLLRTARQAVDGRLQLRPNHGLVAGFDELLIVTVSTWSRPHVLGRAWDLTFTATEVDAAE